MNLREWANATHRALANQPPEKRQRELSHAEVDMVLRQSINVLIKSLQSGGDLRLDDIGRLWVEQKGPRKVVSNLAGRSKPYKLAKRKVIRFHASIRLLNTIRSDSELTDSTNVDNE